MTKPIHTVKAYARAIHSQSKNGTVIDVYSPELFAALEKLGWKQESKLLIGDGHTYIMKMNGREIHLAE